MEFAAAFRPRELLGVVARGGDGVAGGTAVGEVDGPAELEGGFEAAGGAEFAGAKGVFKLERNLRGGARGGLGRASGGEAGFGVARAQERVAGFDAGEGVGERERALGGGERRGGE